MSNKYKIVSKSPTHNAINIHEGDKYEIDDMGNLNILINNYPLPYETDVTYARGEWVSITTIERNIEEESNQDPFERLQELMREDKQIEDLYEKVDSRDAWKTIDHQHNRDQLLQEIKSLKDSDDNDLWDKLTNAIINNDEITLDIPVDGELSDIVDDLDEL